MRFESERVETATFDSYSTLVDVDAAENALADRVDNPEPVSRLWRTRSLEYTMVANHNDAYQSFYELNRDALQDALAVTDIVFRETNVTRFSRYPTNSRFSRTFVAVSNACVRVATPVTSCRMEPPRCYRRWSSTPESVT